MLKVLFLRSIIKENDLVDDKKTGLVWITLNENDNINNYEEGQEIVVWIDGGIRESNTAQAKALNIEFQQQSNKN